uniref:CoA transferase n=1 Tax=Streptomyces sp. NBC_00008 TaxID=2903610 RepID=A0AAU2VT37_9ACTN
MSHTPRTPGTLPESLDQKLHRAAGHPITGDDGFDIHAELNATLGAVGMSEEDAGGTVTFEGADPVVPSTLRVASATGVGLMAKSVAMAKMWRFRGGEGQDLSLDLRTAPSRLCPFYEGKWELLNGALLPGFGPGVPQSSVAMGFFRTRDGRHIASINPYTHLSDRTLRLLRTYDDPQAVREAFARWDAPDLERAGAEAGVPLTMVRTLPEFLREPQYLDFLKDMPLVEVEKTGESAPEPLPAGADSPLAGVRALGMSHIIAGAGIGRLLAYHGADALNIWRPNEPEHGFLFGTASVGVRHTTLDARAGEGRAAVRELLRGADVFYANRRPGYLDRLGLTPQDAAEIRPGIIHASVSLHGERGPWAQRVGFDQNAGVVAGVMTAEGTPDNPRLPVVPVVNDWLVPMLATTGIVEALIRRATEGGSYRVHVSLTRIALWILSLGLFDKTYAAAVAGSDEEHTQRAPELFTARTPFGDYQGITDQVRMSATPGGFRHVVLEPRTASRPEWLRR